MNNPLTDLPARLDYAALAPEVCDQDVHRLCREALELNLCAVCLNPVWIRLAADLLANSAVKVVSVAGFPLGANRTDQKVLEAAEAVQDGAHEVDVVANIGWLCSNRFIEAEAEIRKIRRNLPASILLKVIVEAGKLGTAQQIDAVHAVINGGAQFVKSGTGFFGPATIDQITTLVGAADGKIQVKASGGIKTLDQCRQFLEAGATRLGSSACPAILSQFRQTP